MKRGGGVYDFSQLNDFLYSTKAFLWVCKFNGMKHWQKILWSLWEARVLCSHKITANFCSYRHPLKLQYLVSILFMFWLLNRVMEAWTQTNSEIMNFSAWFCYLFVLTHFFLPILIRLLRRLATLSWSRLLKEEEEKELGKLTMQMTSPTYLDR